MNISSKSKVNKKAENVRNKVSKIDKNPNAADVDERIKNGLMKLVELQLMQMSLSLTTSC